MAELSRDDLLADGGHERHDVFREPSLRSGDVLDQPGAVRVVLADLVVVGGLFHQVAELDARIDRGGGGICPLEQRLAIDLRDDAPVQLDPRIGQDHLQIEDQPAGFDCFDHSTQDVHDALRRHTSQRPGEHDEVE